MNNRLPNGIRKRHHKPKGKLRRARAPDRNMPGQSRNQLSGQARGTSKTNADTLPNHQLTPTKEDLDRFAAHFVLIPAVHQFPMLAEVVAISSAAWIVYRMWKK